MEGKRQKEEQTWLGGSPSPWNDDLPEEHPHTSSTGSSVGGASSHIFPVQLTETAGALRAQHGPTEQAQGRVLPLIICRLGTPERQGAEDRRRFNTRSRFSTGRW